MDFSPVQPDSVGTELWRRLFDGFAPPLEVLQGVFTEWEKQDSVPSGELSYRRDNLLFVLELLAANAPQAESLKAEVLGLIDGPTADVREVALTVITTHRWVDAISPLVGALVRCSSDDPAARDKASQLVTALNSLLPGCGECEKARPALEEHIPRLIASAEDVWEGWALWQLFVEAQRRRIVSLSVVLDLSNSPTVHPTIRKAAAVRASEASNEVLRTHAQALLDRVTWGLGKSNIRDDEDLISSYTFLVSRLCSDQELVEELRWRSLTVLLALSTITPSARTALQQQRRFYAERIFGELSKSPPWFSRLIRTVRRSARG